MVAPRMKQCRDCGKMIAVGGDAIFFGEEGQREAARYRESHHCTYVWEPEPDLFEITRRIGPVTEREAAFLEKIGMYTIDTAKEFDE